ncbi:MAG: site-2 protease family protein [Acidobacteria bacterium]|nr:site-2 protease family protein [Acidobacteriota bacterium]
MDLGFDPAVLLINLVVLLLSLSIHESAHAWAADLCGDYTARLMGRVSLNPLVHIDPIGTVLFPLVSAVTGVPLFGWAKPVPVNTTKLKNPKRDHLLIAAAGPGSNILAAVVFLIGLKIILSFFAIQVLTNHAVVYPLYLICSGGLAINLVLAVFNLIPIPPLDGSWILSGLLPDQVSGLMDFIRPYSFLLLMLLLWSGFLGLLLRPVLILVQGLAL